MTSRAVLGAVIPASQVRHQGLEQAAPRILNVADRADLDGYWIHLDVDILDPGVMPSVDSPDPGGLDPAELTDLLAALAPRAIGAQVTVLAVSASMKHEPWRGLPWQQGAAQRIGDDRGSQADHRVRAG